jgi:signal peptidase I
MLALLLILVGGSGTFLAVSGYRVICVKEKTMEPTFLERECVLVAERAKEVDLRSSEATAELSGKQQINRGDLVFVSAQDDSYLLTRVIGIPGDKIALRNDRIVINELPVGFERVRERFRETLVAGVSYEIIDGKADSAEENAKLYRVPEDAYFVLGDNRDDAVDSRYAEIGYIPAARIVPIEVFRFYSQRSIRDDGSRNEAYGRLRWDRMFQHVRLR